MKLSATEAKNRLGQVLEQAQRAPVTIEKSGRRHSVVMSAEHYDTLLAAAQQRANKGSPAKRFYAEHKAWIDVLNKHVDEHGLWNEELRTW